MKEIVEIEFTPFKEVVNKVWSEIQPKPLNTNEEPIKSIPHLQEKQKQAK